VTDKMSKTEQWLTGELVKLSQQISTYVVRALGADIEKAGPPNAEEEFRMGSRLVELGTVMVARAAERPATQMK
jgi:hypothetical protein